MSTIVVGPNQSIQAAINSAQPGDTIEIQPGTYQENLSITTAGLTLEATGPGVILQGTFNTDNGIPTGTVATWLQTHNSYSTAAGNGILIGAGNVSIIGIQISGFNNGIKFADGQNTDSATIQNVTFTDSIDGIDKPTTGSVTNLNILGGSISDTAEGIVFFKTTAAGQQGVGIASGVVINGMSLSNIDYKGFYFEALSNAHLTNIVMNSVGQFGAGPAFGAVGSSGDGIDLNLKNGFYSNVEIDHFNLTDVGRSNGGGSDDVHGGAIVLEARDQGSYANAQGHFSGVINVHDGSISNTSVGVQVGEPGQTNAGPEVAITNVSFLNADIAAIVNASLATTTPSFATGAISFSGGHWTVTHDSETDVLTGIHQVIIGGVTHLLVDGSGAGGFSSIQSAINGSASGDVIEIAGGTYNENVNVTVSGLTIENVGGQTVTVDGTGGYVGAISIASGVTGVTIQSDATPSHFVLNAASGQVAALYLAGGNDNTTISGLTTVGADGQNSTLTGGSLHNVNFSGNVFNSAGTANQLVYVNGAEDLGAQAQNGAVNFTNNSFVGPGALLLGLSAPGSVTGNTFSGASQVELGLAESGVTVTGNGFGVTPNEYFGSSPNSYSSSAVESANTFGGPEIVIEGQDGIYGSVAAAIAAASPGDVIDVPAGTYSAFLDINKDVTIKGANSGVDPNTGTRGGETIFTGGVRVDGTGAGATIDGVTVQGSYDSQTVDGTDLPNGLLVIGANVTVQNTVLDGSHEGALDSRPASAEGSATGLTFSHNLVTGWQEGVYLVNGASGAVSNNVFTNNGNGVLTEDSLVSITNNTFNGSVGADIALLPFMDANVATYVSGNTFNSGHPQPITLYLNGPDGQTVTGSDVNTTFHLDYHTGSATVHGGAGENVISYSDDTAGVTIDLAGGTATSVNGVTTFDHIADAVGGAGNDTIIDHAGNDLLDGKGGVNTVSFVGDTGGVVVNLATGTAVGPTSGNDTLLNFQNVVGGSGNNTITGDSADNNLNGGVGGINTISYANDTAGVTVDLATGSATGTGIGTDTLSNFQNVIGGSGNDTITGNSADNVLNGGGGVNTVDYAGPVTVTQNNSGGWTAAAGAEGTDTLQNINIVQEGAGGPHILLVGNGGYTTIQAGVDGAVSGDTVEVAGGAYSGGVTAAVANLTIQSAPGQTVSSTGAIQTGSGDTLTLVGTFANAGTIVGANGSTIDLATADIIGGTLTTSGSGVIQTTGAGSVIDGTTSPVINAGTLTIADTTSLTAIGTIENTGVIALNGATANTELLIGAAGVSLTGGGQVVLAANSTYFSVIQGAAAGDVLTNVDNTISGSGYIGNGQLTLTNAAAGVIDATVAGVGLVLKSDATVTNAGLLESTGGAGLAIYSTTINQTAGGTIFAGDASFVGLANADIIGGTLTTAGSGVISTYDNANVLDGRTGAVTNAGSLDIYDNTTLTIQGVIANTGAIGVNAKTHATDLIVGAGGASLTSGGSVTLSDNASNIIIGAAPGDILTNVDNVISGAGQLGGGSLELVNQTGGVIEATGAKNALVISSGAGGITNDGVIEALGKAGLVIKDSTVNGGGGGEILAVAGSHVDLQTAHLIGGTLITVGSGVIDTTDSNSTLDGLTHTLTNLGKIMVVDNTKLTMDGAIANSGSILVSPTSHVTSLIVGSGNATLSGKGTVSLGSTLAHISGSASTSTLTNVDNTIAGAGVISLITLINEGSGVIDANLGGGLTLASSKTVVNAGLIEATGAGTLTINKTTIDSSSGGTIAAGARVYLEAADLIGGTLTSSGSGTFVETGTTGVLDGTGGHAVTLSGGLLVADKADLTIEGTITGKGLLHLAASADTTELIIGAGGATLSGGASVSLTNSTANEITATTAATLTNGDRITGAGTIGNANFLTLVNQAVGLISSNGSKALTIDTGANVINNAGIIEGQGAGGTIVDSAIANTGRLIAYHGDLTVMGAVSGGGTATINSGTLTFGSSFTENVFFAAGGSGELVLAQSQGYTGTIYNFSHTASTQLDLQDIAFNASGPNQTTETWNQATHLLTVTSGSQVAHIHMAGTFTTADFNLSSDSANPTAGTIVTDAPAIIAPFVSAMAAFGAASAGPVHGASESHPSQAVLATPAILR